MIFNLCLASNMDINSKWIMGLKFKSQNISYMFDEGFVSAICKEHLRLEYEMPYATFTRGKIFE